MRVSLLCISILLAALPARSQRLDLSFLPPDLPPGNVCNASAEEVEDDETREGGGSGGFPELDDGERLQFLIRDIRDLTREGADQWFDHIVVLIDKRLKLDPGFSEYDAAFAKINLHLNAGRLDARWLNDLIVVLRARLDELGSNNQVQLARYYLTGIGVEPDPEFAFQIFVAQAYRGNSAALFEILSILQRGEQVEGWTLGIERTAELAFGGLVGQFNRGLCARAERMAREYLDGEYLKPNPDLAFAWRKFAADMGGADAAWRVVEYHLNATAPVKDNEELLHYLNQAVAFGFNVGVEELEQLKEADASLEAEIRGILGYNFNRSGRDRRRSATPYLDLQVNRFTDGITTDSEYLQYLREIASLPTAPPPTITALAQEILLRHGRWKASDNAIQLLKSAASTGYHDAMMLLAELQLQYRDKPELISQSEQLYLDLVDVHGNAAAMKALDGYYRCQSTTAPMLTEADYWLQNYKNTDSEAVSISATDVAKISVLSHPEISAKLQSFGLRRHPISSANFLQVLQSDPFVSDAALRFWARRVGRSDQALEAFVKQQYEYAITPSERDSAGELFRRAFLDVGPSLTLDLAVNLIELSGNLPQAANEIRELLLSAGNRGEGAAIRLLHRLDQRDGKEVYQQFKDVIEARGDFLAMMFAAPFVDSETFDRYMARAISIMSCRTKDIAEIADAYTARGFDQAAAHWLRIGLTLEGGHVLSRLGISNLQMRDFDSGAAPTLPATTKISSLKQAYLRAADPDAESYEPTEAANYLIEIFGLEADNTLHWVLDQYRKAETRVQFAVDDQIDLLSQYQRAALAEDSEAQYQYGLLLRRRARDPAMLSVSTEWLQKAAKQGHPTAMAEYGYALGLGLGVAPDPRLALVWLEKAEGLSDPRAHELVGTFRALVSE